MNKIEKNTVVVNLFAGPGSGKSTLMAEIFAKLKWQGVEVEMATEFAKDLTWENRQNTLQNQIYIFGKQHHRVNRLIGQVDVIITDSPILLSCVYNDLYSRNPHLNDLVKHEHNSMNTINYFINRTKAYSPNGRNQTEEQSNEISKIIKNMLVDTGVKYAAIDGDKYTADYMILDIMDKIEQKFTT